MEEPKSIGAETIVVSQQSFKMPSLVLFGLIRSALAVAIKNKAKTNIIDK